MTAPITVSQTFDALRQFKARLQAESWPPGPNGIIPAVTLASTAEPDQNAEQIRILTTDIAEDADLSWRAAPTGRTETFDLLVVIDITTGLNEDAMLDRLEVLATIVQRSVYDDTQTVPADRFIPLNSFGQDLDGIAQVTVDLWPANNGVLGRATIRYRATFAI